MVKLCDVNKEAMEKLPAKTGDKSGIGVHYADAFIKPMNTKLDDGTRTSCKRKGLITTGGYLPVAGTPFDFRKPTAIGTHIADRDDQMSFGGGYDHNWVLRKFNGKVRKVAEVYEPKSGRCLTVFTDQPGLQFYSGNFLDGTAKGKMGQAYNHRTGLRLEAQGYPDSPNKPQFPSVVLKPGDVYRQTTIYQFSTK